MAEKKAARTFGIARGRDVGEELRRYYETGRQIREAVGCGRKAGDKVRVDGATRVRLMKEYGISRDQFYMMLDFACLYTRKEFDALRSRSNHDTLEPLHWTHVRTLFAFTRDQVEQRTELEKQSIQHGWSARRLLEEVQKTLGGKLKEGGGPRFKYKDLLRWTVEAERYLGGLFVEDNPDSDSSKLVIDRVLTTSREDRKDLMHLSTTAARVGELAGKLAERAAKQRRSRRSRRSANKQGQR